MEFTCVKCGKEFVRLGVWKRHMSKEHGGYDEQDLAQVTSGRASSEDDVSARMESFASTVAGSEETGDAASVKPQRPPTPALPLPPPIKTIKATPKRLKKILASIPTTILGNTGITLDEEDKQALDEAGEFLTEIFGVEFEVDQEKQVLHSRIWAIVWVAGVSVLIYCKHRFSNVWQSMLEMYKKKQAEQKDV